MLLAVTAVCHRFRFGLFIALSATVQLDGGAGSGTACVLYADEFMCVCIHVCVCVRVCTRHFDIARCC